MQDWSSLIKEDLAKLADIAVPSADKTEQLEEGERREVAILFMDLSGFTAMSEKLDHEIVHRITTGVMQTLSRVVEGHGGYVDKYEGDLIMALFGAQKAAENDCARAVTCATRMLDTLGEVNGMLGPKGITLAARVGVNAGWVTVAPDPSGHMTVTGDAVNLASRMESTAKIDTVQVTAHVREQCRDLFAWEDLGEITVKGKSEPIHTFRPTGVGQGQKERWERAARVAKSPMLGRDRELRVLSRAWSLRASAAEQNRRGGAKHIAVGLKAEAGIGKSRLTHEFLMSVAHPEDQSAPPVLHGRTLSYAQPSFWIWTTLLRSHFGIGIGDKNARAKLEEKLSAIGSQVKETQVKDALKSSTPFLAELLSIAHDDPRLTSLDEQAKNRETLIALRNIFRALGHCEKAPVIILEDTHWMDASSAEVLEFLVENCDTPRPLFFLLLYRPEKEGENAPAPRLHAAYVESREIELAPIDEQACRGIIRNMIAATYEVDRDLAETYGEMTKILAADQAREVEDFILKQAQGNPFCLEELVLSMIESGALQMTEKGWALAEDPGKLQVPSSLAALARSRMDHLEAEPRQGLQRASVIGMEFALDVYKTVAHKLSLNGNNDVILSELETRDFIRRMLMSSGDNYQFKHIITRNTAYETLLRHNRIILHRCVAQALEELFPEGADELSGIIATHWHEAQKSEKAVEWGMRAQKRCRRLYLNDEGLSWSLRLYEWIGEFPEDEKWDAKRYEILDLLEAMQALTGKNQQRRETLERMMELTSRPHLAGRRGEAQGRYGMLCREMGRVDEAQQYYEEALANLHKAGNLRLMGLVLHSKGILTNERGNKDEALKMHEAALEVFHKLDEAGMEARVLNSIGILYDDQGKSDDALGYYKKSLEAHRAAGDRVMEGKVLNNLGGLNHELGRLDEAPKFYNAALAIAGEIGDRRSEGISLANLAILYEDTKQPDKAMIHHRKALEIHREVGNRRSEAIVLGNLALLLVGQGETDEALVHYEQAMKIYEEVGDKEFRSYDLCQYAAALMTANRSADAQERLDEAWELLRGDEYPKVSVVYHSVRGRHLLLDGDSSDEALEPYQKSLALIDRFGLGRDNVLTRQFDKLREDLARRGVDETELLLPEKWR